MQGAPSPPAAPATPPEEDSIAKLRGSLLEATETGLNSSGFLHESILQ